MNSHSSHSTHKQRIAFLDQGETLGGAERFLLDFLNSLSAQDYKKMPSIVLGGAQKKYRDHLPKEVSVYSFPFPSVKGSFFTKVIQFFKLVKSARALRRKIQEHGITTIFSNTPRTSFVVFLAQMLGKLPVRSVMMIHDFSIPGKILKAMAKKSDVIVVSSIPARHYVRKHICARDYKKIKIIENSVDLKKTPKPILPTELKKVLILGRIDPQKGQQYALGAADLLLERNPDIHFSIIGSPFEGDPETLEYEKSLRAFQKKRKLTNVTFLPEVDTPFETMNQYDCVLALPTRPETFGRIVIEALALGKLVLVFQETGPKDILQSYEHFLKISTKPLIIESKNEMSLAETIGHFSDNPEEMKPFTENAHEFIAKQFAPQESKKRLIEILINPLHY